MPKTILIPIPISKSSAPRFRNSVEGLNQEIERIIIRDTPEKDETIVVSPANRDLQDTVLSECSLNVLTIPIILLL